LPTVHGRFAQTLDDLPSGRFAHWSIRYMVDSPIGQFAPWTSPSGRFAHTEMGSHPNSAADSAAKDPLLLPLSSLTVPHSDYKSIICLRQWQLHWNYETENKLHSIEPRVNVINICRLPRQEEVKNWTHISYAWTFTSRGDSPSVLGLSNGFDC